MVSRVPAMKRRRSCELCDGEAAVYCAADSAFLCLPCDARVHGANFLAARHVRRGISATRSPPICGQDLSTAAAAVKRWSRQLGLRRRRRCVRAAARVLVAAGHVLPGRVGTAAALWAGIRAVESIHACEGALRRLAAEAHVPAKLIVAGEWRLRWITGKSPAAAEEGWGECC